jgi:hypothetical protein
MAESELHFLRARMQGGLLARARRGELKRRLPAGLAYDAGTIMPGPDTEVRGALQLLPGTFTATGSARAVVAAFNKASLTFPGRPPGRAARRRAVLQAAHPRHRAGRPAQPRLRRRLRLRPQQDQHRPGRARSQSPQAGAAGWFTGTRVTL